MANRNPDVIEVLIYNGVPPVYARKGRPPAVPLPLPPQPPPSSGHKWHAWALFGGLIVAIGVAIVAGACGDAGGTILVEQKDGGSSDDAAGGAGGDGGGPVQLCDDRDAATGCGGGAP